MPSWAPSISCPFLRRLVVVLSEDDLCASSRGDALLFQRLLELEMDAERQGASEASCRVIGRVRRLAATTAIKSYPPTVRGH